MKSLLTVLLLAVLCPAAARAQRGHIDARVVNDSFFGRARSVHVYTPAGYDAKRAQPYDLIIAFDGPDYLDTIPLPLMLDTLAAGRHAPQFVAVLVDDSTGGVRTAELGNNPRFADFLAKQLVPWVRANWNVTHDRHHTIVTGSSAGGLGAAFVAFMHPELFGNVLSQSGAFWRGYSGSNLGPYEWLTAQYAAAGKKDIVFFLDVGSTETRGALGGAAPAILDANRHLRAVLKEKGYNVTYNEVPGGVHAPETWRVRLPFGIVALTNR